MTCSLRHVSPPQDLAIEIRQEFWALRQGTQFGKEGVRGWSSSSLLNTLFIHAHAACHARALTKPEGGALLPLACCLPPPLVLLQQRLLRLLLVHGRRRLLCYCRSEYHDPHPGPARKAGQPNSECTCRPSSSSTGPSTRTPGLKRATISGQKDP